MKLLSLFEDNERAEALKAQQALLDYLPDEMDIAISNGRFGYKLKITCTTVPTADSYIFHHDEFKFTNNEYGTQDVYRAIMLHFMGEILKSFGFVRKPGKRFSLIKNGKAYTAFQIQNYSIAPLRIILRADDKANDPANVGVILKTADVLTCSGLQAVLKYFEETNFTAPEDATRPIQTFE